MTQPRRLPLERVQYVWAVCDQVLGDRGGQVLKGGSLAGVACVCVGS